jgi:transcriptional/translational regulatory protein YebC/TACO1
MPNLTMISHCRAHQASVAYLFSRNGSITFEPKEGIDSDAALDAAIEVGAEDVNITESGKIEACAS